MSQVPPTNRLPSAGAPSESAPLAAGFCKWELVGLLWFAFFLNQGDRQIYNVVMPLIGPDLNLDAVQLGLVATIFTVIYGVLVPVAGYVGDVFSRKWMVFASLLIFSVGTVLTGTANGFLMLVLFRSLATGAGEAFYYPAANALIGEFHRESRARAMAIHQTANYTGVVVSGFLAAWIGERWGWRTAFLTFGGAGVVWAALVAWRIKGTPQQAASGTAVPESNRNDAVTTTTEFQPAEIADAPPDDLRGFFNLDPGTMLEVIKLNTVGTLIPCQVFGRDMARQGRGSMVNFASMNSYRPLTKNLAYSLSKAGVVNSASSGV